MNCEMITYRGTFTGTEIPKETEPEAAPEPEVMETVSYLNNNENDNVSREYETPDYGGSGYDGISFTDVSESLYYHGGHLG